MKERPMLLSGAMVRATLENRKRMTRRVNGLEEVNAERGFIDFLRCDDNGVFVFSHAVDGEIIRVRCPYGVPGDRLWVRETWAMDGAFNASVVYRADGENQFHEAWKPSIHMFRKASRITLEVKRVRVERLQGITEEDAVAEGLKPVVREKSFTVVCRGGYTYEVSSLYHKGVPKVGDADALGEVTHVEEIPEKIILTAREAFRTLWGNINGRESWDANPWVWVVEFERVEGLIV